MRVMKFGGTSLGTAESLKAVVGLVAEGWAEERVVVVASALSGVTQEICELIEEMGPPCSPTSEEGWNHSGRDRKSGAAGTPDPIDTLKARHLDLWREVLVPGGGGVSRLENAALVGGIERRLEELRILRWVARAHGAWTLASRDQALGIGEALSALLLAGALRVRGIPARCVDAGSLIRTDSGFGAARVAEEETKRLVQEVLGPKGRKEIAVVPGFVGADGLGRPTTLGRGASDYTATLLAGALSARLVEVWTDVDGIFTHDPRRDPRASRLERMVYGEARALALAGAKVLHPKTLDPIEVQGIPLWVRNTFRPDGEGTVVGPPVAGREVHLVVAGATGGVGRALLAQLRSVAPRLLEENGLAIRVAGLANSRGVVWWMAGIPLTDLPPSLDEGVLPRVLPEDAQCPGGRFSPNDPPNWNELLVRLKRSPLPNPILVDCTASPEVADLYLPLLEAGIPVVTPNKLAVSGELSAYLRLLKAARDGRAHFKYETTAGAALPVIRTIRDLVESGDRIRAIEGVLSGTLSFVFHRLGEGVAFSRAVREAREEGLTEPHPGEDLSGADVGRKLLILCREGGFSLERRDFRVESLIPPALKEEKDPERFLKGLERYDRLWAKRVAAANEGGLAYVASFRGEGGEVGVRNVLGGDALFGLRPTENRIVVTTDRNLEVPLTISGPGAGREVTSAGVLTDLLSVLREMDPGGDPGRTEGGAHPGRGPRGKRRVA